MKNNENLAAFAEIMAKLTGVPAWHIEYMLMAMDAQDAHEALNDYLAGLPTEA